MHTRYTRSIPEVSRQCGTWTQDRLFSPKENARDLWGVVRLPFCHSDLLYLNRLFALFKKLRFLLGRFFEMRDTGTIKVPLFQPTVLSTTRTVGSE